MPCCETGSCPYDERPAFPTQGCTSIEKPQWLRGKSKLLSPELTQDDLRIIETLLSRQCEQDTQELAGNSDKGLLGFERVVWPALEMLVEGLELGVPGH